jgi:hypothetical protein
MMVSFIALKESRMDPFEVGTDILSLLRGNLCYALGCNALKSKVKLVT